VEAVQEGVKQPRQQKGKKQQKEVEADAE